MRLLAILLSLLTIAALELLLLLGAAVHDRSSIEQFFNGLVMALDLSLVTSSGLLGYLFARQRRTTLASVFFLNIGIFVVAVVLRVSGVTFPPLLLFGVDLYWLSLYLVCLSRYWRDISSSGSA
ncbi:MAG TPA: hypothetical protein VGY53_06155 [Isosphaeraceae bacterium]|nr:hypothetical protein [Isosphaeraceae bacterium]